MNHTPGPWRIIEGGVCLHVESEDRSFSTGCLCFRDADPWANARLIASAPELLEVLKAIQKAAQQAPTEERLGEWVTVWLERINNAIAKAEGKATV